ncbi:hypothetical protein NFHSH190041_13530 [Shewanella sp. NFH-SH190041]|nr:hypothetical protein NFHSH190041_13530 [Shewanella sp. NFH-SH190041]
MAKLNFAVANMNCGKCVRKITALLSDNPASKLDFSLADKAFSYQGELSAEQVLALLAQAGFDAQQLPELATETMGKGEAHAVVGESVFPPDAPLCRVNAPLHFVIANMRCGSCAKKIRALFESLDDVTATTDVAGKQLWLSGNISRGEAKIRLLLDGFDVADGLHNGDDAFESQQQYLFSVPDMSCGHCKAKIEQAFAGMADTAIQVDLVNRQVRVRSDQAVTDLLGVFAGAAFPASLLGHEGLSEAQAEPACEQTRETYWFNVPDMSCGHCQTSIEAAFADVAATEVSVLLEQKQVKVVSAQPLSALLSIFRDAGYPAELFGDGDNDLAPPTVIKPAADGKLASQVQSVGADDAGLMTFYVPDMSCASCVAKIERAFTGGATQAVVNLADKQVQVSGGIDAATAINLIAQAGYQAELVEDAKAAAQQKRLNDQHEYRQRMAQAALGLGLGVPLMIWGLAGGDMMVSSVSQQLGWGVVGVLTALVMLTTGRHFYQGMWRALKVGSSNMDTLIVLGTSAAWLYSMVVVLLPQWFPAGTRHVYFEASVMILGLINLGHALELRARGKTSEAVQKLIGMQSSTAIRITSHGDEEVEISMLQLGDKLRLRPGDRVALDGIVVNGSSTLDEAMLTGEPLPVHKQSGDPLSAGTVNGNGALVYQVTALARDTRLAKIIQLVQQAQTSKMPIGRLTDKIAAYFVPVVVLIALIAALIWYLAGPAPQLSHALVVLTSVLIIACPCALGLATPMSIMVAVGRAAQLGILVKNGEALQTAAAVDTVVLDKTGTVTEGKPQVTDILLLDDEISEMTLLSALGSLEQHSEHPLAAAMVARAKTVHAVFTEPEFFQNHQGMGITGRINGQGWVAGNRALMAQQQITGLAAMTRADDWADAGKTPVFLACDGQLVAMVAISDPVKIDAKAAIARLRKRNIRVVMLTGDNNQTAAAVAKQVGIDEVIANVLPHQKQAQILALQQQGRIVAMVGDGINDTPALVSANVGIAMGTGTEVAIESADMTLLSHQLTVLGDALALSRATMGNIKQNLFGAFIYNSLGIPVAAGILFPLTGMLLSPVVAGAAMALSSLTVVSNANRLKVVKLH